MNNKVQIAKILESSLHLKISENEVNKNVSALDIAVFCKSLLKLMRSNEYQIWSDENPLMLILNVEEVGTGENILVPAIFQKLVNKGIHKNCNLLKIDIQGNLIEEDIYLEDDDIPYVMNNEHSCDISYKYQELQFFLLDQNSLSVCIGGRLIREIPNIYSLRELRSFRNAIPISNYGQLISKYVEYFKKQVKPSLYWHNKRGGVLKAKPEDTFINDFNNFLELYVADGRVDSECFNNHTDDRLDIRVVQIPSSQLYIFEIKWIGKCNTNNGGYNGREAQIRANSGIKQIQIYLSNEPDCCKGILMVYDAREEKSPINWIGMNDWNAAIHVPPFMIELNPVNASTAASKLARKEQKEHEQTDKD